MEVLRVGSLNINGMRDRKKCRLLSEITHLKDIGVVLFWFWFYKRLTVIKAMRLIGAHGERERHSLVMGPT